VLLLDLDHRVSSRARRRRPRSLPNGPLRHQPVHAALQVSLHPATHGRLADAEDPSYPARGYVSFEDLFHRTELHLQRVAVIPLPVLLRGGTLSSPCPSLLFNSLSLHPFPACLSARLGRRC